MTTKDNGAATATDDGQQGATAQQTGQQTPPEAATATGDAAAEAQLGDAGKELLARFRKELKEREARIKEFETAEQTRQREADEAAKAKQNEGKDDTDQIRDALAELRNELEKERTARTEAEQRNAFTTAAQREGVRPEAVNDLYAVVRAEGIDITDPAATIAGLRDTKPFYFGAARKSGSADGGAGNGGGTGPELSADEVKFAKMFGMKPEQYAQHKE